MVAESQGSSGVVGSAVGGLIVFGFDGEVGSIAVAAGLLGEAPFLVALGGGGVH